MRESLIFQFANSLLRLLSQRFNFAKLDGLCRTCRRARRCQPFLLPVIAECALKSATVIRSSLHDPNRARYDAISTAVADIRLDVNAAELRSHDRARRAGLQATSYPAVLAHIRRKTPRKKLGSVPPESRHRSVLNKLHMPPGRMP